VTAPARARRVPALGLAPRTSVALVVASVAGLAMLAWPLVASPPPGYERRLEAPFALAALLPVLVAVLVAELTAGRLDTKGVAMLGVLTAVGAAARLLGAGVAGVEPLFVVVILGGRAYGPGFGFVLGATTLFTSALLTAGVGPWLPSQMLGAAWVGLGAGLLPPARGRAEVGVLAAYGALAAYAYGFLVNLWFWPFAVGPDTALSYVAGAPVVENLRRFATFTLATSTWGWDTGRALTTVAGLLALGPALLLALRRASRRAAFDAEARFEPAGAGRSPAGR